VKSYDIAEISRLLAGRVEEVCLWLLPNGKRNGNEWCVGDISGNAGNSLKINLGAKAGLWTDFSGETKGGDLVDLIMRSKDITKGEAVVEAKQFLGIDDSSPEYLPKKKPFALPAPPQDRIMPKKGVLDYFMSRGITAETVELFKIAETNQSIVFPYLHEGKLYFYKCRAKTEKKFWVSPNAEPILFGWQAVPVNTRYIAIVEGEIDAMSLRQQGIFAVSVPFGGGTKMKQDQWISCEWERLQLFDTIYLALDNDKEGLAAAEQIAQRLGTYKCKKVNFGKFKDANEALLAGENLQHFIDSAEDCKPPELVAATEFVEDVISYYAGTDGNGGYTLPWGKTYSCIRIRKSELSVWVGTNGHGKSCITGYMVVDSIAKNERWCVASMEFKAHKLLARLFRQVSGESKPNPELCRTSIADFFDSALYLFNVQGTAKAQRIIEVFEYAFRRFGCTSFLVDSLAKCGFDENDYNGQKRFMDELTEFAHKFDVHVHVVCHPKKIESEDKIPGKFDVKGTGALTDTVDNVFVIWRNKKKEAEKTNNKQDISPDCIVDCCKQRNGEWEGRIMLWFDPDSLQYKESENSGIQKYLGATLPQT